MTHIVFCPALRSQRHGGGYFLAVKESFVTDKRGDIVWTTARLLPQRGDGAWEAQVQGDVQAAYVDAQLQRIRRADRPQVTLQQRALDLPPLLRGIRSGDVETNAFASPGCTPRMSSCE